MPQYFKSLKERNIAEKAIEDQITELRNNGKHYSCLEEYYRLACNMRHFQYEKENQKYLELFGMDAGEYLSSQGMIPTAEEIINILKKKYDAFEALCDLQCFLVNASKGKIGDELSDYISDHIKPWLKDDSSDDYILEVEGRLHRSEFDNERMVIRDAEMLAEVNHNIAINELETISVGSKVKVIRDPHNPVSENNVRVETDDGIRLGVFFSDAEKHFAPVMDCGIATVENAYILAMDLSNRRSPKVVVAFDIIPTQTCMPLLNSADWYKTKNITLPVISDYEDKIALFEQLKDNNYYAEIGNAIFRGFKNDILAVASIVKARVHEKGFAVRVRKTNIPDIYELRYDVALLGGNPTWIIEKFPELKCILLFAKDKNWACIGLSRPGYGYITDYHNTGEYDHKSDSPFYYEYWPDEPFEEDGFYINTSEKYILRYVFCYEEEWNAFDYLLKDGDSYKIVTEVRLPGFISGIDDSAYAFSESLDSIYLPASLERIGDKRLNCGAFWTDIPIKPYDLPGYGYALLKSYYSYMMSGANVSEYQMNNYKTFIMNHNQLLLDHMDESSDILNYSFDNDLINPLSSTDSYEYACALSKAVSRYKKTGSHVSDSIANSLGSYIKRNNQLLIDRIYEDYEVIKYSFDNNLVYPETVYEMYDILTTKKRNGRVMKLLRDFLDEYDDEDPIEEKLMVEEMPYKESLEYRAFIEALEETVTYAKQNNIVYSSIYPMVSDCPAIHNFSMKDMEKKALYLFDKSISDWFKEKGVIKKN